jgi:predicted nucleic acid-binding Zn finger protein
MPAKAYRTVQIPLRVAESFAACIRANPRFKSVEVRISNSDPQSAYVAYLPAHEEARILLPEERARQLRAKYQDFIFVDGQYFVWVFNPLTGKYYQVSSAGCTCPDFTFRCRELKIDCKHIIAAKKAGKVTRSIAQRAAEVREAIRKEGIS